VDHDDRRQDLVRSLKIRAGRRRTYFLDIRRTRGDDFFITMTESTRRFDGDGFERHKIYLYKEDFNRFLEGLEEAVDIIKKELMPDYDFEEFDRRQLEYEARMLEERDGKPAEDYKSDSSEYKDDRSAEDMDWK
jgi:hypothetical protein